jgi:hypothetical protein
MVTDADPNPHTAEPAPADSVEGDEEVEDAVLTLDDRFRFNAQNFQDAMEALREMHTELAMAASGLDNLPNLFRDSVKASKRLSTEEGQVFIPLLKELAGMVDESGQGLISAEDLVDRVFDLVMDEPWGPEFALAFLRRTYRPRREPIFHSSILISVVAAFEAHLGELAKKYYHAAPAALHDVPKESAKEFSLRELQEMGSIELAVDRAIESRVAKLTFGSFADWRRFFDDRLKINMAELTLDWKAVTEILERRHCIVHHGSQASRRYVSNFPGVEQDDDLQVDADYVEEAIARLELLGLLVSFEMWRKFAIDEEELITAVESIAFMALKEQRWGFSLSIYKWWQGLSLPEYEQRQAKVNIWVARKGLEGLDSIANEVRAWDVSGSDEVFAFAKYCLLEDLDSSFAALPRLIEMEKVGGKALATWPLLEPLRADERIHNYDSIMRDYVSDETDQAVTDFNFRIGDDESIEDMDRSLGGSSD